MRPIRLATAAATAALAVAGLAAAHGSSRPQPTAAWCTLHRSTTTVGPVSYTSPEVTYPCP
jgi:hypothetical protein